ncbi:hypothetical protein ACGFZS_47210 [Streptomyces sp. NPDC048288]|uniref:hypothetical protein n=1 Tax=Streptomyces sp. NPDC048288 TaxID=3365529 RepID=UPI0037148D57
MSAARLIGAAVPLTLLLIGVLGAVWVRRQERLEPSSFTRRPDGLAVWRSMSVSEQEAYDTAVLDAAQAAAERAAAINALYHP